MSHVWQGTQHRPEQPTTCITWHASNCKDHILRKEAPHRHIYLTFEAHSVMQMCCLPCLFSSSPVPRRIKIQTPLTFHNVGQSVLIFTRLSYFRSSPDSGHSSLNGESQFVPIFLKPPHWGTKDVETQVPAAENPQLSKVLSFQPGGGHDIALHVSLTARNPAFLISAFIPLHFCPIVFKCKVTSNL